jgi:hypothetical protein
MNITVTCLLAVAALALTSTANASFNSHIGINVDDGQLITEDWISGPGYQGPSRVFAFQQDETLPNFFDIGTNSVPDTFAYPGMIGFNFLNQLSVWNGDGFAVVDSTFTLSFGPASATTTDGFVEGFGTAVRSPITGHPADQWGRHHVHLDGTLNDLGDLNDGVYMIAMELWYEPSGDNTTTYLNSPSFFVLLSLNADDEVAAVRAWTEANLVPAPGALTLLVMAGLVSRARRRK